MCIRDRDGTWAQFFVNFNDEDIDVEVHPKEECILVNKEGEVEIFKEALQIKGNSIVMLTNNTEYKKF